MQNLLFFLFLIPPVIVARAGPLFLSFQPSPARPKPHISRGARVSNPSRRIHRVPAATLGFADE